MTVTVTATAIQIDEMAAAGLAPTIRPELHRTVPLAADGAGVVVADPGSPEAATETPDGTYTWTLLESGDVHASFRPMNYVVRIGDQDVWTGELTDDVTLQELLELIAPAPGPAPEPPTAFVSSVTGGDGIDASPGTGAVRVKVDNTVARASDIMSLANEAMNEATSRRDADSALDTRVTALENAPAPDSLPATPSGDVGTVLALLRRIRDGDPLTYWAMLRLVPTSGRVGSVLARVGDPNGDDYEFRLIQDLIANGVLTEAMLSQDVKNKLNARGGGASLSDADPQPAGTADGGSSSLASRADHVHPAQAVPQPSNAAPTRPTTASPGTAGTFARGDHRHPKPNIAFSELTGALSEAQVPSSIARQSAVDTAAAAAAAAQLEADTVIEIGPALVHNDRTARNLSVNIRHPVNAYSTARVMTVSLAGQPAVIVEYDHTVLHQDVLAGITTTVLTNLWNVRHNIPDGQGGQRSVQTYSLGSFVPVTISLLTGRGGETVFTRTEDLLVIETAPHTDAQIAAVPSAALFVTDIARYDAAQNRFEDSDGDAVNVPNGAIVVLPQAAYDAAVSDADFTPNAAALFLTT